MEINPHLGLPIDQFIEKNMKLGHKIVKRFTRVIQSGYYEYKELLNLALMGMTKAYQKFNPTLHENVSKFSTYAEPIMKGEILKFMREQTSGPRFSRTTREVAWTISKNDWFDQPHEWILAEIKKKHPYLSKIKMKHVKESFDYLVQTQSMDKEIIDSDGDSMTLGDKLGVREDFTQIFVDEFLATLDERERLIMKLRMEGLGQKEIGKAVGISQMHVSRTIRKIGDKLLKYQNKERVETPTVGEPIKEKIIIKEENEMVKAKARGDRAKAKELLANTVMTYKEISDVTGVPLGTVSILGLEFRDEDVRKAMGTKDPIKKAQLLREAGFEKESDEILNEVRKVEVETTKNETPKQEAPISSMLDDIFGKNREVSADGKSTWKPSIQDAQKMPTVGEAIAEYEKEMMEKLRTEMEGRIHTEMEEEFRKKMADKSEAEQASIGTIQKFFTFRYKASGGKVSSKEFMDELQDLIATLDASGNEFVTFTLDVEAE